MMLSKSIMPNGWSSAWLYVARHRLLSLYDRFPPIPNTNTDSNTMSISAGMTIMLLLLFMAVSFRYLITPLPALITLSGCGIIMSKSHIEKGIGEQAHLFSRAL